MTAAAIDLGWIPAIIMIIFLLWGVCLLATFTLAGALWVARTFKEGVEHVLGKSQEAKRMRSMSAAAKKAALHQAEPDLFADPHQWRDEARDLAEREYHPL